MYLMLCLFVDMCERYKKNPHSKCFDCFVRAQIGKAHTSNQHAHFFEAIIVQIGRMLQLFAPVSVLANGSLIKPSSGNI